MFDIATRPQPISDLALDAPFDWALVRVPRQPQPYYLTDYLTTDRQPVTSTVLLRQYVMDCEDTLATAVVISLFTHARAGRDDRVMGSNRGGWVGSDFIGDEWGSRGWTIDTSKTSTEVLDLARLHYAEALAWMVRDGVAGRIVVDAEWVPMQGTSVLAVRPQIYQATVSAPVYDALWSTGLERYGS